MCTNAHTQTTLVNVFFEYNDIFPHFLNSPYIKKKKVTIHISLIFFFKSHSTFRNIGFPDGSVVKNPPANAGNMGQKASLEKGMATHSSNLAWEIPPEEHGRLQPMRCKEPDTTEAI